MRFDEALLRQAFYQNLLLVYLTNRNGSYRADVMLMTQAAAVYAPGKMTSPVDDRGWRVFKLGEVARANGDPLAEEEAHNALNDVWATLELARFIRKTVPEVWDQMMQNAVKSAVNNFVNQHEVFHLTNFFPVGAYTEVVTMTGRNLENANEIAVFNLRHPPKDYVGLDTEELLDVLADSPKNIRTIRANAQPIIMPFSMAPDEIKGDRLDDVTYQERAQTIRSGEAFQTRVSEALPQRYPEEEPSPYVEKRMYDGFISSQDEAICPRFHELPWSARVGLCEKFSDRRLAELGRRLIFVEQPDVLSTAERAKWKQWESHRLMTEEDVPWTIIPKAVIEVADLRRGSTPEANAELGAIVEYLEKLAGEHDDAWSHG